MRRNIDGTCSPSCCSNPNIRTINTMNADTQGNFTIRGDQGIHVTVGTNEIIISGIAMYYDNTDGNIAIDNDLMTINLADDITITGDMIIAGDLTVNGTYYTVHAEHVYTQDDYIILREGATTPLAAGSYAGFQVTKYDGTNDGRLVIDNAGVARVGDVGDEQPLLTRDEAADLTDGDSLVWDAANSKAVTQAIPTAISTALSGKGINNDVSIMSFANVTVPATTVTDIQTTTLTEAGTYLLLGVVSASTAMSSGLSVKGFTIGGSLSWISTNAATGDGQYASFSRIVTVPANTTVSMTVYFSAQAVTISGELSIVRLE